MLVLVQARALWRTLEHTYHGVPWAGATQAFEWNFTYSRRAGLHGLGYHGLCELRPLWGKLLRRINSMARPSLIPSLCTHFKRAGIEWRR